MRIIDRRNQALGGQRNDRTLNQVTHIVVHHTASARTATTRTFEQGVWRSNGWDRGGYHEVVLANGDVEINYNDRRIVWGARNQNTHTWHIALVGQHGAGVNNITAVQLRSLERRISEACRRLAITNMNRLVVHNALPGQATACTAVNMGHIRSGVGQLLRAAANQVTNNGATHTVRAGETLSGIANRHRTTVAELVRLNNISNPHLIRVGQVLRIPAITAVNHPSIRVGSRVRVNSSARTWATGQMIPTWVRGQTYTVQQLRNNELLLAGVMSWIRRSDVTVI